MSFKDYIYLHKYNLLKPGSLKYYGQLLDNQKKSRDELDDLQWKKTLLLMQHAAKHSPFYRKRFKEIGADINDFKTPEDFDSFPVLTRNDLQESFRDILCDNVRKSDLVLSSTGGSSGQPVAVYMPRSFPRAALGWRMYTWWGISPSANWGRTYRETSINWKKSFIQHVIDFPIKTILLNASSFTENDILHFIERFNRVCPPLLQGYVGAIDTLADYVLSHHIRIHQPKAVWVTSAPVSKIQRNKIEQAFQTQVFDQYGCCEVFWLAAECSAHSGLHMFYDARRIDFLDQQNHAVPTGDYGSIAITDLTNYAFPIIRYLNGDTGRALKEQCGCGCNLPLMDHVKGRISDTIKLPSGRLLNGEFVTTLFDNDYKSVKRFHVHQNADYSIRIEVVSDSSSSEIEQLLNRVTTQLKTITSNEISISAKRVPEIKLIKDKLRFITSDIQ